VAQRSLHVATNVYYRSISCFDTVSRVDTWYHGPACSAKVSQVDMRYHDPSCTVWAWAKSQANPHSSKQDMLHIVFLISKQIIPYRTRDVTCYPRVSTPNIRSLADSSTTCHNGINHLQHYIHCLNHTIDPSQGQIRSRQMEDHIYHTKTQAILNIIKMEDLDDTQDCMAKHTNQVRTQIPKV
jgi:hypothetical protein